MTTTDTRARPSGPGWLPGPVRQGAVDRETLWYDDAVGLVPPTSPPWAGRGEPGDARQPERVPVADLLADPGRPLAWPTGGWQLSRRTPFPGGPGSTPRARGADGAREAGLGLLAHAVSPVRRDPDDPYNDHRAYPSPRCLFPVVGSVVLGGQWHVLDADRRLVVPAGLTAVPELEGPDGTIALSGRYDAIPSSYGWFRGGLVALETGVLLRHLAALGRLHGVELDLRLPSADWSTLPVSRLWRDPEHWSPPVVLTPRDASGTPTSSRTVDVVRRATAVTGGHLDDPGEDLRRVYRSHGFTTAPGRLVAGIPTPEGRRTSATEGAGEDTRTHGAHPSPDSWSQVLWRRSAGRMPRGLYGFRVADDGLDLADVDALLGWAAQPAPDPITDTAGAPRLRAVVRDVRGVDPGVYDVVDAHLVRRPTAPPDALARLAGSYLYGSDQGSHSDIARAPLVLVTTSTPRAAVRRTGPEAWTALQLATGWLTQGVALAAADRHLVARPVRALDERDVAVALDLDDDEMVGIALVVFHHAPHGGLQIDLRS